MFHIDNQVVVHILKSQTSLDLNIMHLLRSLLKVAACFNFTIAAIHVPGINNGIVDALCHFSSQGFHSQAPGAKTFLIINLPQLHSDLEARRLSFMYQAKACVFLPRTRLIPCGTLQLKCICPQFSLLISIKDSSNPWRTAFGFKELPGFITFKATSSDLKQHSSYN